MWYAIMIGGGAVLFAVFLALYFYYRDGENTVLPRVFSVLSVVGLAVLLAGIILLGRPYLLSVLPTAGDYIIIGVVAVALLLAFWFLLRPAFTAKNDKDEEVKKITATGTRTVSTGSTKKKKKKNNSMKAQMGTSKKRRLPRY